MSWVTVAVAGASVVSSAAQSRAAGKAADAQSRQARNAIEAQEFARLSFEERTDPFRQAGLAAAPELFSLLGIEVPQAFVEAVEADEGARTPDEIIDANIPLERRVDEIDRLLSQRRGLRPAQQQMRSAEFDALERERDSLLLDMENNRSVSQVEQRSLDRETEAARAAQPGQPGQPGQPTSGDALLAQVNPLVSFLREEGFEDIQESAAAQGRLRSGGTLEDLTRFNTNIAATVAPQLQQQRFNQLFNLLGLGSNVAAGQGTAGLQTATNIGGLMGNIGQAQAGAALAQGQAIQSGLSGVTGALGAYQGGAFRGQQMTQGGVVNTGTQTDFATGAQSSPVLNRGGF